MKNNILKKYQDISKLNIPMFDYHMHTNWTDGINTSYEMYERASKLGLKSILFSEHARKSSEDWFYKFANEIRLLPKFPCQALVGVEAKIVDFEGNIDSTDKIIGECDLVMASVHRFPGETNMEKMCNEVDKNDAIKIELELSLGVLENDDVDILGHPFGMSLKRFGVTPPIENFVEIIKKASTTGVAIEVNSHYHDNVWEIINLCKDYGTTISLGSNAHNVGSVGDINNTLRRKL
jgi:putative hydrolase